MLVKFSLFVLFPLISLSSQSTLRVVSDGSDQRIKDSNSSDSIHNADHAVLKHLHTIYNTDLQKKDIDVKQLLILKQQYIVRNHIEEFEVDFSLNFIPDWTQIDKWSSPARQSIEIRKQRWQYIFSNHSDLHQVQNLANELSKSGINQTAFCNEIAEAYFILSHNAYIYNKGPMPNEVEHRTPELVDRPLMDQSLRVFLHAYPDSHFKLNTTEELIQIPKSVYYQLLRRDTQVNMLKKHHESEMKRQKNNYENVIRDIQEDDGITDDDDTDDSSDDSDDDSSDSSYRRK